jgi:alpha-L-fucosidase 2
VCAGLAGARALAGPAPDDSIGPVLLYRQPAKEWVEALPTGNGRLGGMVFGGVPAERIQLNEDTFWSGGPYDPVEPEALSYLPKLRQLVREGRYEEAQDLADRKLMGRPRHLQAYQPLGDLRVVVDGHERPADYRRELDLDRAVVRVRYRIGDTTFTREAFSSAPDQSIVVRLTSQGPARLRLAVTLDSKHPFAVRPVANRGLLMSGRWRGDLAKPDDHLRLSHGLQARWYGDGLAFAIQLAAEATGGRLEVDEKGLRVVDARSVTLRLAAATSFRGRDPAAACAEALRTARPYEELLARHVADHRSLFRRVAWTSDRRNATPCPRTSASRRCARERSTRASPRRTSSTGAIC